jgi:hypothetical protein
MWEKNKHLKEDFVTALDKAIQEGTFNASTDYNEFT